ncbi:MAG: M23 family metallopeptidase [Burkholderiales bacterium]|nr:M23 family metallopeptidase [Burkholderiales bacterium]
MNLKALRLRCTPVILGIAVTLACAVSAAASENTTSIPTSGSDLADVIQKWVNDMDVVHAETIIEDGDTSAKILERLGVRDQDINLAKLASVTTKVSTKSSKHTKHSKAHKVVSKREAFGKLVPGHLVQAKLTPKGEVISIRIYNNRDSMDPEATFVEIVKDESSSTKFRHVVNKASVEMVPVAVSGVVKHSLSQGATDVGIPQSIQKQLELQLAQFNVNKTKTGDTFSVLYEKREFEGTDMGPGRLLAFEYYSGGKKKAAAFWFDNGNVRGYFREDGTTSGKSFQIPCQAVLTSPFNRMRRHPVTRRLRPHWGVDLAAPYGTPIYAASDGKVYKKTFQRRGYGNYLEIDHGAGYTTLYAHMSKFAIGMEEGSTVRKGQLIGYVGRTGLTTGSHLHYELRKDGSQVNPLLANEGTSNGLTPSEFRAFQLAIAPMKHQVALSGQVQFAYNKSVHSSN